MESIENLIHTASKFPISPTYDIGYLQNVHHSSPQLSPATPEDKLVKHNNVCQWKGCYQKYDSTKDLFEHVKELHVGRKRNGLVNLQCFWSECKAEFPKRYDIISHIHVHIPYEPYICEICNRNFKRKSDMVKHQKLIHVNPIGSPNDNDVFLKVLPGNRSPLRMPLTPVVSSASLSLPVRPTFRGIPSVEQCYPGRQMINRSDYNLNGINVRTDIPSIESILGEIKSRSIRIQLA